MTHVYILFICMIYIAQMSLGHTTRVCENPL